MSDLIKVNIVNWEKFNPRKDIKRPTWFAFDNRMVEDSDFFDFNAEEFKAWIYILSIASQKNSKECLISAKRALIIAKIPLASLNSAIRKLLDLGILTTCKIPRTRTSQTRNVTDRQTDTTDTDVRVTYSAVIDYFSKDKIVSEFIAKYQISEASQKSWVDLYPEIEFVRREILKATAWLSTCSRAPKSKTGYNRFINGWLARGWEAYRKSQPAHKLNVVHNL